MNPYEFIDKWKAVELKERSASQEHFLDLCRVLDEPTPAESDPIGVEYCFERGAQKDSGGDGWADVWKRHHFAWEYKGKRKNLDDAFEQLRQYALALENPPLLIVSDMEKFRIRTNWTNSVSVTYEFGLEDLLDGPTRDKLKWAFTQPELLRPGESRQSVTERAAASFAGVAQALRDRGHAPIEVARFINRIVFCMFADDVGLLPNQMFARLLRQALETPAESKQLAVALFDAMAHGSRVGIEPVSWFNGGLFDNSDALPLNREEIKEIIAASNLDWSEIDPSILGTLFERGLDPDKRAQLGAHYTDRDKILQIVEPVIVQPLLAEWSDAKNEILESVGASDAKKSPSAQSRAARVAERRYRDFLSRLRSFKVLDPACGSGNFLYLALQGLKDLEHRIQIEAESLGFPRTFPEIGPRNLLGIEINPFAAELARVSIWIGEIQWMRRNGFAESRNPVLKPLRNIECKDAILAPDGTEPSWPEADVVIGNPPFLGTKPMRSMLGDEYTDRIHEVYSSDLPAFSDLVCYWFFKAGKLVAEGTSKRVGLVATNSIRGGRNRKVLDRIVNECRIYDAWSDEPWVVDGAAVRVSLICFGRRDTRTESHLNGLPVSRINADLTSDETSVTVARQLNANRNVAFIGHARRGPFTVPGEQAQKWLALPNNPNGRPNSDVLMPWVNGREITQRNSNTWIVNFGPKMGLREAALYEEPFGWIESKVKPMRRKNRNKRLRDCWWLHEHCAPSMWRQIGGKERYIATPTVSKHRVFAWVDSRVCPDHQVVVIARDDDTVFGILHSRFHEMWSLRLCTWLGQGNDPRYTPTTTFATYPFPPGLTPDLPTAAIEADPRAIAIGQAAKELVLLRDRWLNPPDLIMWDGDGADGFPKRPTPSGEAAERALKERTLTRLYNRSPHWLMQAHERLDAAVARAYGWPSDITDRDAIAALLALNRAAA